MKRAISLISFAFLLIGTAYGALNNFAFADDSVDSQIIHDERNEFMYRDMQRVGDWLGQYCMQNHRFPEIGDETSDALSQLNQLVYNNPYRNHASGTQGVSIGSADPLYSNPDVIPALPDDTETMPHSNRIALVYDPSLTDAEVNDWIADPPIEWRARPGQITAISNQTNLFVIWGAGADGKPICDFGSNNTRLVVGHYIMLFGTY
jgi:hypothetical protein